MCTIFGTMCSSWICLLSNGVRLTINLVNDIIIVAKSSAQNKCLLCSGCSMWCLGRSKRAKESMLLIQVRFRSVYYYRCVYGLRVSIWMPIFPIVPYPSYGYLSNNRLTSHILTFDIDHALALSNIYRIECGGSSSILICKSGVEQHNKHHNNCSNKKKLSTSQVKFSCSILSGSFCSFRLLSKFNGYDHLLVLVWCQYHLSIRLLYWILKRTQK